MKARKILLFLLFFLSCQIVFAQTVNSSITIRINNGKYLVSGIVKSDAVKNEVIEKIKAQLGSKADFSKISFQAPATPFQEDWQAEFDKSLSKIKSWKSGVFIFSNRKIPNYPPLPAEIVNAQILLTDGQTVSLKDYRNKVVVLLLFAPWSLPTVRQAEDLNKFYSGVSSRNIEIIGLIVEDELHTKAQLLKSIERYDFKYKIGWVDSSLLPLFTELSKKETIPQTFVTFNGTLRDTFEGYSLRGSKKLQEFILEILDENDL